MIRTLGAFSGLFAATFVFLTGNGLLNTLLSTRMAVENLPTPVIGTVLSAYFVGLLLFLRHLEKVEVVPVDEQVAFVAMKNSSPVVMTLDPRAADVLDGQEVQQPACDGTGSNDTASPQPVY